MLWLLMACADVVGETGEGVTAETGAPELSQGGADVAAPEAAPVEPGVPASGSASCLGGALAVGGPLACGTTSLLLTGGEPVDGWGMCLPSDFEGVVYEVALDSLITVDGCGLEREVYAIGAEGSCLAVVGGLTRLLPGARLAIGGEVGPVDVSVACP